MSGSVSINPVIQQPVSATMTSSPGSDRNDVATRRTEVFQTLKDHHKTVGAALAGAVSPFFLTPVDACQQHCILFNETLPLCKSLVNRTRFVYNGLLMNVFHNILRAVRFVTFFPVAA